MKKIADMMAANGEDRTEVWHDEMSGKIVHNFVQETFDACLEANRQEYNEHNGRKQHYDSEVANKVASIPLETVFRWKQEGLDIFRDDPETKRRLRQKLNSPEYRYLRTRPGRL